MGSPITFSGFNSIDFNLVLNSVMASAAQPLTALQNRQSAVQSQIANLATLTAKASAVQSAAAALSTSETLTSFSATSSNSSSVAVSGLSGGVAGHYDIIVNELARAQVTASTSSAPDANTTAVATGGALTINGQIVSVTQPATLQQLADAINAKDGIGVTASVIQSGAGSFRLVLTSNSSGTANAFTVTNTLNKGVDAEDLPIPSDVSFADTDNDGVSGDSDLDNAVKATDAEVHVNNIKVTSASNTLTSVIPGATITVLKKDDAATIGIDVAADTSALRTRINTFVAAYNSLNAFTAAQRTASGNGDPTSIGRDPLIGQLRTQLRTALNTQYDSAGALNYLSQIGVEFTQSGTLQVNNALFASATQDGGAKLAKLLVGTAGTPGAFASINTLMTQYTQTSGLLAASQSQRASQVTRLTEQIGKMQDRLALQRASLQREFAAADAAMTSLKNQSSALASFGTSSSKLTSPTSSAS